MQLRFINFTDYWTNNSFGNKTTHVDFSNFAPKDLYHHLRQVQIAPNRPLHIS